MPQLFQNKRKTDPSPHKQFGTAPTALLSAWAPAKPARPATKRALPGTSSAPSSDTEVGLGTVVEHQDQGATNAADHVGEEALVEPCCHALLSRNLLEAIH